MSMRHRQIRLIVTVACSAMFAYGSAAFGQVNRPRPRPTDAEWSALATLPDFTGVWEQAFGGVAPGGNRGDVTGRGDGGARGRNGGGGRGVGRGRGANYTTEYLAKARPNIGDELSARCIPPGMPSSMDQPYPIEILMTPGKVTMLLEAFQQIRHIYTDGRSLPEDPDQRFQGTSVGHWEGDTLMVETVGFSPNTFLSGGVPHGNRMTILERMRLTGPETMTIETTIADPEALTTPIVSTKTLQRHRTWTLAEYVCEENNRNTIDEGGHTTTNLGNPGGLPPSAR